MAFFISLNLSGQKFSDYKPLHTSLEDSLVIIKASTIYDSSEFILYTNDCSSKTKHIVYTLGTDKQKPILYRWTFQYKYFGVGLFNRKLTMKKTKPKPITVAHFESKLEQNKFSELKTDSLKECSYFANGEKYAHFIRGCKEKFVLVHRDSDNSTITAKAVEKLQDKLFSPQREAFIAVRNAFLEVIE